MIKSNWYKGRKDSHGCSNSFDKVDIMNIEKLQELEPFFDQWYLDRKVAQGRSSEVFRVTRNIEQKDEYLAIKVIRFPKSERDFNRIMQSGKYTDADEYLDALETKLKVNMEKMMGLRNNSNIIRFDKYMIVREFNCFHVIILMELLTPLGDYLSQERLVPKEIAKMGVDICCALEGFRQAGIMHREVKPENIFVDDNGSYKLGDFGIDEVEETGDRLSEISNYLAPEVLNGSGVDYSSDVYSLGIMMYKFTNHNRMPFSPQFPAPISLADRQQAFERRMSGERLPKPDQADIQLAKIIFKATAFRPEQRYASPEQPEDDLRRYLLGLDFPVGAAQRSTAQQAADADRAKSEFEEAFSDDETEKKPNTKLYILIAILAVAVIMAGIFVFKAISGKEEETTVLTTTELTTTQAPSTEEPTTEAPTTEPTTEAPTTAEPTTEAPTTTEPTTAEPTTQETTEPTTVLSARTPTLYQKTKNKVGDIDEEGREYAKIKNASAVKELSDDVIIKVIIDMDGLGDNPEKGGHAFICQVSDGTVILKEAIDFDCIYDETDPESGLAVVINIDREIYYEADTQYYIVFEEGAIVSDTNTNLPAQVKI